MYTQMLTVTELFAENLNVGSHLGFMQIAGVAQSCRVGNHAEIVQGPHGSKNQS